MIFIFCRCTQYLILDDSTRNINNQERGFYCDRLDANTSPDWRGENWYRFQSGAGVLMPESTPGTQQICGTKHPGWLNGAHPTEINQLKQVQVCFHHSISIGICLYSVDILVTNCGDYYVYFLKEVPFCDLRYCGMDG